MTPEEKESDIQHMLQDIRILAMMPPQRLKDIRWIYDGNRPETPGQVMYEQMKRADPVAFDRALKDGERDYRISLRDLEEKWGKDARGIERVDGGYERLKKLINEMLGGKDD